MRRRLLLFLGLVIGLLPLLRAPLSRAAPQEASLSTPIARNSEAKYKIDTFTFSRASSSVGISVVVQDSSNNDIRTANYSIPSPAGSPCTSATTLNGLAGAMNAVRASETGTNARIQQFRILGYLVDQGCLTGVTLVP